MIATIPGLLAFAFTHGAAMLLLALTGYNRLLALDNEALKEHWTEGVGVITGLVRCAA